MNGRLRWIIFTASVLSTEDNPDAHLWRALGGRLSQLGHHATFYEQRGNAPLRALLQHSGSRALTEFRARHPEIAYRTHEQRRGADLVEWMTRTLATADVALAQATANPDLIGWLGKLTRPHLQTFMVDTGWNDPERLASLPVDTLESLTAILLGGERQAQQYRTEIPSARLLSFTPLPTVESLEQHDQGDEQMLVVACDRLIEAVRDAHNAAAQSSSSIGANGFCH